MRFQLGWWGNWQRDCPLQEEWARVCGEPCGRLLALPLPNSTWLLPHLPVLTALGT